MLRPTGEHGARPAVDRAGTRKPRRVDRRAGPAPSPLRLMGSGVFDAHPGLRIVLGHMGEGLPYNLWRVDNHNAWMERTHLPLPRPPQDRRLLQRKLLHHHIRELPHPGTAGRNPRTRRRPGHVFHRLAVRERRPCRGLVRLRPHQRKRPAKDRPGQRGQAIPAGVLSEVRQEAP